MKYSECIGSKYIGVWLNKIFRAVLKNIRGLSPKIPGQATQLNKIEFRGQLGVYGYSQQ